MKQDNKIIVDINKVQWARLYYRNQHGDYRNCRPDYATVFNQAFLPEAYIHHVGVKPNDIKTMIEHAQEHKLLDVWTLVLRLKLTANEYLEYTGNKAESIYKAWCEKIFKKGK